MNKPLSSDIMAEQKAPIAIRVESLRTFCILLILQHFFSAWKPRISITAQQDMIPRLMISLICGALSGTAAKRTVRI